MNLVVTGVVAGVLGTMAMDSMNHLLARTGLLVRIDMRSIGRMSSGWARGRFRYRHPGEMKEFANEVFCGYVAHYAIGVVLAIPFLLGWDLLVGGLAPPLWTLAYGVATTSVSVIYVYPSMGLGLFGKLSPEGIRAPLSSLANHFFFGVGMAVAVALA